VLTTALAGADDDGRGPVVAVWWDGWPTVVTPWTRFTDPAIVTLGAPVVSVTWTSGGPIDFAAG
jgi:hypothetical protein